MEKRLNALTEMKEIRAFKEGYSAFIEGIGCRAPALFGTYSGKWVEGWEAALFSDARYPEIQLKNNC
jgi:hypothetical protein